MELKRCKAVFVEHKMCYSKGCVADPMGVLHTHTTVTSECGNTVLPDKDFCKEHEYLNFEV